MPTRPILQPAVQVVRMCRDRPARHQVQPSQRAEPARLHLPDQSAVVPTAAQGLAEQIAAAGEFLGLGQGQEQGHERH
ncbi:hypothetical protein [Mameliella alba]|uniref:hypothetical protein n=1 Tax=Mameliella alba TaxID=561184 RepID=UPI0020947348|nr:hypothetical protein [Mameliella alba]